MKRPTLYIGCAGWNVPGALAASFPGEGSHLERYAAVLPMAEIDTSFYRSHRPATYARWRDSVPEPFRFAVKLPRTITRDRELRDVDDLIAGFVAEAGELRHKLGCVLVQLPPGLVFDAEVADDFFTRLGRAIPAAIACEPRHASWFDDAPAALLARHHVAFVQADPPPRKAAEVAVKAAAYAAPPTAPLVYLRLHGSPEIYYSAYDDAFLAQVAERIRGWLAEGRSVWCVFDNTARGAAPADALRLRTMLGIG